MTNLETGYYGIELQKDEQGYYLFGTNGDEKYFDVKPTDEEIKMFVESIEVF